jgi:exodeoxyribonuclease-3
MIRTLSWNVNGIRACARQGFVDLLNKSEADIVGLQEVRATKEQVPSEILENKHYPYQFYVEAEKKGYSGVGIISKINPETVIFGCGNEMYDKEGRVIQINFKDFSIISAYHPSGSSGDERQAFKMVWLNFFMDYIQQQVRTFPNLIVSGDYNICNKAIDIHNPNSNANSSGFLPEEREWFDKFLESGFVDSFRKINQLPKQYTWWSFRAGARGKNLGWRIDYNLVSKPLEAKICDAYLLPDAKHSDHCPCVLVLDFSE